MQKRYKHRLPEIYAEYLPLDNTTGSMPDVPIPLDVFEMTYLHYHRHLELGYCVSGVGESYVEGYLQPFQAGDVFIVFPFQRHNSRNTTSEFSRWYWVYIDLVSLLNQSGVGSITKVTQLLQSEMGICGIISREQWPNLVSFAKGMIDSMIHPAESSHRQERMALNLYQFLLMLSDASVDLTKLTMHTDQKFSLIKPALDHINLMLDRETIPPVEDLSQVCCMSSSYFRRIFHLLVGISPKEYITMCCMRKATLLLSLTNQRIIEIAMHCGYQEISSFNRCFIRSTGLAPSEYRRIYRGTEIPASLNGSLPSGLRPFEE